MQHGKLPAWLYVRLCLTRSSPPLCVEPTIVCFLLLRDGCVNFMVNDTFAENSPPFSRDCCSQSGHSPAWSSLHSHNSYSTFVAPSTPRHTRTRDANVSTRVSKDEQCRPQIQLVLPETTQVAQANGVQRLFVGCCWCCSPYKTGLLRTSSLTPSHPCIRCCSI